MPFIIPMRDVVFVCERHKYQKNANTMDMKKFHSFLFCIALGAMAASTNGLLKNIEKNYAQNISVFAENCDKNCENIQTDVYREYVGNDRKSDVKSAKNAKNGDDFIQVSGENGLEISAKSAYLMDYNSGTAVFAKNELEPLPIASMCKIMTLILAFDAVDEGVLTLDECVKVSDKAASMGGSQVFLEAGGEYTVANLIKSIVVCSANDSCVALAERLYGDEQSFTDKMNEKAANLGAENTLFANCTGLPKEPQYSCAKDVAVFLRELTKHEDYFKFSRIWTDRFDHPQGRYTDISNTNKLIRFYEGCDGGKTGFTNQAGFCLAATARRGDMRIISVVIGEQSSDVRFKDVRRMFDYTFSNYTLKTVVDENNLLEQTARVQNGKQKHVAIKAERGSYVFSKRGEELNVALELHLNKLCAPIKAGACAGEIVVYRDNVEIDRINVVAAESVKRADLWDRLKSFSVAWNN